MNDLGAVSVGIWQMACRRVIKIGERAVKNMIGEFSSAYILDWHELSCSNFRSAAPSEPVAVPAEMEASFSGKKSS